MSTSKLFAVALAAVMLLSVFALPGVAAASATADASITDGDENGLIDVAEDGTEYIVTVTENDTVVNDTTVNVTVNDENVSYVDAGNHTTDENGTFALGAPDNESVNVTLEATIGDEDVSVTEELEPVEDDDAEPENFGALVSSFVDDAQNETDGPMGLSVAGFVVENNPGNAPDHAGPPAHAGPSGDDEQGPPAHAGGSDDEDDSQGPPAHAGPSGEDEADEEDEVDEEEDTDSDDSDEMDDEQEA